MPFALIIVGVVLLIAAAKGTQGDLFSLLQKDFTGPNNFVFWMAAILIIGAVGYVPKLKPLSTVFLALVVLVLFLSKGNKGSFFEKFTSGIQSTTQAPTAATPASNAASVAIPALNYVM